MARVSLGGSSRRGRPANTRPVVGLGGAAVELQVFPAIRLHPCPAGPVGTRCSSPRSNPGPPGTWHPLGTSQRLLCPGRQVALLQRDASSQAAQHHLPPPAMHILLEKISLLRFQVPAEMRLKNVQNAVFSSFPLCVSQHVLQTGHFLIVLLWLSRAGIREAFILPGERDYKSAAGLKEPRSSLLKYLHELLGPNPGVSSRGHKHCGGVLGAPLLGAERVLEAGGPSAAQTVNQLQLLPRKGL